MDFLTVPECLSIDRVQKLRRANHCILQRLSKGNRQIFFRSIASDGVVVNDKEAMVRPVSGRRNDIHFGIHSFLYFLYGVSSPSPTYASQNSYVSVGSMASLGSQVSGGMVSQSTGHRRFSDLQVVK